MLERVLTFVLLGALVSLGACSSKRAPEVMPETPQEPIELPEARAVGELYNARLAGLDRLWARAVTAMTWTDDEGKRRREQGDGHFMFVEPGEVALTIGAPHRTIFHIGSGELDGAGAYWFIDLVEARIAYVARAGERLAFAGVPLQPLDILRLAGLRPIELEGLTVERAPEWASGEARVALVEALGDGSQLRVIVDARSGEPVGAELRDGGRVVRSRLSDPQRVYVRGGGIVSPLIPSRIDIESVGEVDKQGRPVEGSARIVLSDPEISSRRPRAAVFDLEILIETYGVDEIRQREPRP